MIVAMTVVCDPDTLSDVAPADFVDALKAQFAARPDLRECRLTVSFCQHIGRKVESVFVTGTDSPDPHCYEDLVSGLCFDAFNACCSA